MVSEEHYVPDYMRLTYANRFSTTPVSPSKLILERMDKENLFP